MFFDIEYSSSTVQCRGMGHVFMKFFWRRGYGQIIGGLSVLELAADNLEAALGKGPRYTSTGMLT
jgi:hypothetical protein